MNGLNGECIEVRNVTKNYGKVVALNGLSFSIPCGEKYALLGPNGSGKSTTLRLVVGLLNPDSGEIRVSGADPSSRDARSNVGYLPEDASPYRSLSVRENLEYIAALREVADVREAADSLLDYLALREYEKARVGRLSRGNMQKLAIALALVHKPKILLLDEPLNYLDIPTQERVISYLNSLKATHLVSTHIMSIASRLTKNVIMISRGTVLWKGSIDNLKKLGKEDEPIESIVARMMTNAQ